MSGNIDFIKMEGAGNDYIYIEANLEKKDSPTVTAEHVRMLSDRSFGIGADGLIELETTDEADIKMNMWNADGSRSAVCGNALRCVAFLMAKKTKKTNINIKSSSRIYQTEILNIDEHSGSIRVNMGKPIFEARDIPFLPEIFSSKSNTGAPYVNVPLKIDGFDGLEATILSMGNPHCVIFVPNAAEAPVETLGSVLESHPAFPERTNVEFVSHDDEKSGLYLRTFERGSGETLACGSGACATLVASVLAGRGPNKNSIRMRGGTLQIEWQRNNSDYGDVYMEGPVREVYRGTIDLDNFIR